MYTKGKVKNPHSNFRIECGSCGKVFERVETSEGKEFCSRHKEIKQVWKEAMSERREFHCMSCDKEVIEWWEKKLQHLKLNPLSIAKFFWKKRIDDVSIIQRLIYFSYLGLLRNGILLFEEKFQAWMGGPVLPSVFRTCNENYENLNHFFEQIDELKNEKVLFFLEKIAEKYLKLEISEIYKRARNKTWEIARKSLKDEYDISRKIEINNLVSFISGSKKWPGVPLTC